MTSSLETFIEQHIIPRYAAFDTAHREDHARHVINASLRLAEQLGADIDMAYAIAAYHDLGLVGPRETHHLLSGEILEADERLLEWFTPEQMHTMREAVEDHRASAKRPPRSVYGMIVSEADRDLSPETVIHRTVQYGLSHYPELDREGHYQRVKDHLQEKYSEQGYIKLWLPESDNAAKLAELRAIHKDETRLRALFDKYFV